MRLKGLSGLLTTLFQPRQPQGELDGGMTTNSKMIRILKLGNLKAKLHKDVSHHTRFR
jgi:hypothetical protein